ncbi:hypothetical protein [Fimbriiglobus ruber]|uniref:hypothetical protein n=1 Tax=Fimbriiglobus ruber TaxID=1908690 RepID=UPI00117B0E6F|nr:hypothetical protein [Fimbriiglobus ruber]
MATTEHVSWPVGNCLCDKPLVMNHTSSPDHPWGGATSYRSLDCGECSKAWYLSGSHLVNLASERSVEAQIAPLEKQATSFRTQIGSLTQGVLKRWCEQHGFPTKKQEWETASTAGLYTGTLQAFYKDRQTKSLVQVLRLFADSDTFRGLASSSEKSDCQRLQADLKKVEQQISELRRGIQRVRYKELDLSARGSTGGGQS